MTIDLQNPLGVDRFLQRLEGPSSNISCHDENAVLYSEPAKSRISLHDVVVALLDGAYI